MKRISLAFGLAFLVAPLSLAQDPTKDPRYKEFQQAKSVVVAKLDEATVKFIQESFPPRYIFEVKLLPKEVLRGDNVKDKAITARYGVTSKEEPKLPVGKDVLVQLEPAGQLVRVAKLEEPTEALLKVARAATKAAKEQQEKEDEIAKKDPTKHPRFQSFKDAAGIAVVTLSPDGSASFDAATKLTTIDMVIVEAIKGDLKNDSPFKGTYQGQGQGSLRLPSTQTFLVSYTVAGGAVRLLSADDATDTLLRVAKAAK